MWSPIVGYEIERLKQQNHKSKVQKSEYQGVQKLSNKNEFPPPQSFTAYTFNQ